MKIAVIVPAHNEAKTIARVVREASAKVPVVIVVDDGSTDSTGDLAREAGAEVVVNTPGRGYDGALQRGFEHAASLGVDIAITMDADGQHDPELLPQFITPLSTGSVDLVVGVRPHAARWAEAVFGAYTRFFFGIGDILCGMKGYNMNLYKAHGCFDSTQSVGTELALWALRSKYRFATVDVPIQQREDESRFGGRLRGNLKIFKAFMRSFLG